MVAEFNGKYRFLSNFWIEPDGTCVETEYQAMKCQNEFDRKKFMGLQPGQAKRLGRSVIIRQDWEAIKVGVMGALVLKKFEDHKSLRELLLATKNEELVEGNNWNDRYWGVCNGHGKNMLGNILMKVRKQLSEEKDAQSKDQS